MPVKAMPDYPENDFLRAKIAGSD